MRHHAFLFQALAFCSLEENVTDHWIPEDMANGAERALAHNLPVYMKHFIKQRSELAASCSSHEKSDDRAAESDLLITSMITDRIGRYGV